MTWLTAARVAQIVATVAALALMRRRPDFRPFAWYLAAQCVATWARAGLVALALEPARAHMRAAGIDPQLTPFTGGGKLAAVALDGALRLLAPALLGAVAVVVFLPRPRPLLVAIGAAWALASVALFALYPATRGAVLARWYLAADLAGMVAVIGATGQWFFRVERPSGLHAAVWLCLAGVGANVLAGAYRAGDIFRRWADLAAVSFVTVYAVLTALEVFLWMRSERSKS